MQFSKNNIWSIACSNHVYACLDNFYDVNEQRVPGNIGNKVRDAIRKFVFDKTRIVDIDAEAWPANNPCAYWKDDFHPNIIFNLGKKSSLNNMKIIWQFKFQHRSRFWECLSMCQQNDL